MVENHFSQLPIVDSDNILLGIVTTESITHALINFNVAPTELTVNDAVVKPRTIEVDEDLMELLDDFLNSASEAVLIVDKSKKLFGLITHHDITRYLQERAEYNILLGEIEKSMKDHIRFAYNSDIEPQSAELQQAIDNLNNNAGGLRIRAKTLINQLVTDKTLELTNDDVEKRLDVSFPARGKSIHLDKLTLSEFIQLIQNKDTWKILSPVFRTSKDGWIKMMNDVREIRNDFSHFRNNFSSEERYKVRFCADWYKSHQPLQNKGKDEAINADTQSVADSENADLNINRNINNLPTDNETSFEDQGSIEYKLPKEILAKIWTNSFSRIEKEVEISIENKYQPFVNFLLNELKDSTAIFETDIDFIEEIIRQPLPKAAREHTGWWTDYSAQSRQWLLAGWAVRSVSLTRQKISFYRWSYIINKGDTEQVNVWAQKLGITEERLLATINQVGAQSSLVSYYLNNPL
ncbi:CBS domain protein [Hymenobacter chitinivorans DSM 11115]|uniref:CBS domain protein n=2 Tax=Hymenobacter chitinivorans TaxID=89969 RepID=A0A2M9BN83_9BACT|nr:CBS domain protein [Hymenobacter chitinivorans DSM 11115]